MVYQMTKSALLVGVVTACQFIPILGLTLIAGTLIDRYPKRTILLITQFGFLLLGLAMTILVFSGVIQYWQVLVIALGYGTLQSIDTPTRQSFVVELVGQKDLMNGISLNSSIFNLAKIVGPAIAGILIVKVGIGWCFLIDTGSYIAVILGLYHVQTIQKTTTSVRHAVLQDIHEGLAYVWHNDNIRISAEMMLIVCTLNFNNNVIIPIYAQTVLHQGAQGYASLLSATGIGSLIAAFLMSYLARYGLRRSLYLLVTAGTIVVQMAMVFVHSYGLAWGLMVVIGFCNMIFLNQSNASFQFSVPDALRGRIMSVYVLLNQGSTPIGSLYVGGIMDLTSGLFGFPACGLLALILLVPLLVSNRFVVKKWLTH
ncbi:major facilitator superfamily permease [Agrilactobacillus composti DSM 18527 = JCM 14202]|uniref:Major facilitator superfamily permease n=1 Tax=Agrilactobacillus composti DSM 18527 = JCM 14202 TaxID=1423734 RepID=X0PSF0_9LACO|nr:major facilitator superfamily permease [Agrilactobacillus composti DSM 18527 = JCM 14202]GAF40131.1 permease [Agrilactobacillus composti DSM 18527 = JCM 14202]